MKWVRQANSRSMPALSAGAVECSAPRSLVTYPLKPHSSRSLVVRRYSLSHTHVPLISGKAHMTPAGSASRTAISKGSNCISLRVRWSMSTA